MCLSLTSTPSVMTVRITSLLIDCFASNDESIPAASSYENEYPSTGVGLSTMLLVDLHLHSSILVYPTEDVNMFLPLKFGSTGANRMSSLMHSKRNFHHLTGSSIKEASCDWEMTVPNRRRQKVIPIHR